MTKLFPVGYRFKHPTRGMATVVRNYGLEPVWTLDPKKGNFATDLQLKLTVIYDGSKRKWTLFVDVSNLEEP